MILVPIIIKSPSRKKIIHFLLAAYKPVPTENTIVLNDNI